MRARLLTLWETLRSSYWFIPALMTISAIVLAIVTTTIDQRVGSKWVDGIDWLYANRPDGARALLSTIAGSMITVAGVTFSINIAAVAYATSQFGPRLLTNFLRDRGHQITLGTFIATFIYCLLVLRTVRSPNETRSAMEEGGGNAFEAGFVPHIAVLCALGLALASVGVLIYFLHHAPRSIHASYVISGIGEDLLNKIQAIYPDSNEPESESEGHGAERIDASEVEHEPPTLPDDFFARSGSINAKRTGYLQYVDFDRLFELACRHEIVLRVVYRPGDFVLADDCLVHVWPGDAMWPDGRDADPASWAESLADAFVTGSRRTQTQDVDFLFDELVEIAARALSPGINDPFTAIACIDYLSGAVAKLSSRRLPPAARRDREGTLRMVSRPLTFGDVSEGAIGQLRPYVAKDRNAALHQMKRLAELTVDVDRPDHREILLGQAAVLRRSVEDALDPESIADVSERYDVLIEIHSDPERFERRRSEIAWLGGSA